MTVLLGRYWALWTPGIGALDVGVGGGNVTLVRLQNPIGGKQLEQVFDLRVVFFFLVSPVGYANARGLGARH